MKNISVNPLLLGVTFILQGSAKYKALEKGSNVQGTGIDKNNLTLGFKTFFMVNPSHESEIIACP